MHFKFSNKNHLHNLYCLKIFSIYCNSSRTKKKEHLRQKFLDSSLKFIKWQSNVLKIVFAILYQLVDGRYCVRISSEHRLKVHTFKIYCVQAIWEIFISNSSIPIWYNIFFIVSLSSWQTSQETMHQKIEEILKVLQSNFLHR